MSVAFRGFLSRSGAYHSRFISTSNTLSSVPTKSKIITEKTVTPRTYHDDNLSEESSHNPLKYSSTKAVHVQEWKILELVSDHLKNQDQSGKHRRSHFLCLFLCYISLFFVKRVV